MGEPARPEAGPRQAAVSAAVFAGLLWLWATVFFAEIDFMARHHTYGLGPDDTPSLLCRWVQNAFVLLPCHVGLAGALASYALWQRGRDFGAAMARVMFYVLFAAGLLLFCLNYLDLTRPTNDWPLPKSCHRSAVVLTFSVLGISAVACALYAHWRSRIAPWILIVAPFWHALAAVTLYPVSRLDREMDIAGGLPVYYPTVYFLACFVACMAVLVLVLVWTATRWRVPPDGGAAILMAGLAGLISTTFVLFGILLPWLKGNGIIEADPPGLALVNSVVYWSFILAEGMSIYLIWRHHRREGAAAAPPPHPAPPLD